MPELWKMEERIELTKYGLVIQFATAEELGK